MIGSTDLLFSHDLAQHPAMASFAAGYPSLQNETPEEAQSAVWLQAPEEEENEYDDEDEEEEEEQPSFTRRENEDNDDASMSDTPSEDQITRKSKKKERRPIVVTTEQVNQELAERARNRVRLLSLVDFECEAELKERSRAGTWITG